LLRELEKARKLKEKLRRNKVCLGAQVALTDATVAEIFGRAGFDWLVIDTEHAAHSLLTVKAILQAAVPTDTVALARPLRLDADEIRRFLDLGSPGVMCPFINSAADARLLVRACRYPPAGIRGWGPRRAAGNGFDTQEYLECANDSMVCIPIIESVQAVENIDEIVSVDGIDGISVGPMDLSMSMGCFQQFTHPDYLAAIDRIRAACARYGKAMGTGCYSGEHAASCIQSGDTLLLVAGDDLFLSAEAKRQIAELRSVRKSQTVHP
jgi:2-keto-3-deoxy-L-rhamnonate aldolase RhmA